MVKRFRCVDASNEILIPLNVGGQMSDVSMGIIKSFQYLQACLSDNFQSAFNEGGQGFVDRCLRRRLVWTFFVVLYCALEPVTCCLTYVGVKKHRAVRVWLWFLTMVMSMIHSRLCSKHFA